MPTHGPSTTEPGCPRCGYDQSGEIATWTDRCPLTGTCTECGTELEWAVVFDPSRGDIRWLVEHAAALGSMARRTPPTLLRMILPWVFWSRVRVHSRTDPVRLIVWVLWLTVAVHLLIWAPTSVAFGAMDAGYEATPSGLAAYLRDADDFDLFWAFVNGLVWPIVTSIDGHLAWTDDYRSGEFLWRSSRMLLGIGVAWFCVIGLLPGTRRMARLRTAHLFRALLLHGAVIVLVSQLGRVLLPLNWNSGELWPALAMLGLYAGAWLWSLLWWACALRIGWGIRSWTLLLLGTIAAILGGVVLMIIEDSIWFALRNY